MQFRHPEILYALLLLIIPILVHLFQLQRFVKVPFTNVKFLKKIEQQTRKSSRLKKWLILATRMLAFSCLIIAFSQPYFSKNTAQQNYNITIYLDNSYSMQAKGEQGELLKSIAQNIIENTATESNSISLLTNSNFSKNLDASNLKNELINIQYSPNKFDLNTVLLQLNNEKNDKSKTLNENIIISDFQNIINENKNAFTNVNSQITLLKAIPMNQNNIYIDSVYISDSSLEEITINILVKSVKNNNLNVPVSLFEGASLVGKTRAKFDNSNQKTVQFTIPNTTNFKGKISVTDAVLEFDNDFYFCISKPTKIAVLSIGNNAEFLAKIYTENEFDFSAIPLQNLNYNTLQNQQLIILNELPNIPEELIKSIDTFLKNGGSMVIIPSENCDINSYNNLFQVLEMGKIEPKIEGKHNITSINYEHPLIKGVFEKKVTNFQYPTTELYYNANLKNSSSILQLDNHEPFISSVNVQNSGFYWVASPLNSSISDFTKSSLIVPIFYNFAKNSLQTPKLYYTIGSETTIEIQASLRKDEVVKISNNTSEIIPLQTISQNKVHINLENTLLQSGFYSVTNNNNALETIAFNYNSDESNLQYANLDSIVTSNKNITILSTVDDIFTKINNQQKINWLFKWFLAFSVLFLFIEMLILKYFKI